MRPNWNDYWTAIVPLVGTRGTCDRGRSGAIIVDTDNLIVSTGYVGAPSGMSHCDEVGHLIRTVEYEDGSVHQHCQRTIHAEMNAIRLGLRRADTLRGFKLYCSMVPCPNCALAIINERIDRVIALRDYHGSAVSKKWLVEAGIHLDILDPTVTEY